MKGGKDSPAILISGILPYPFIIQLMKSSGTTYDTREDLALISRARGGDSQAFESLVRRYQDLVFKFAFKLSRNREMAEELYQDTFVNVFRKLNQFDGKSKFSTWLYRIVANNYLMKNRKSKLSRASVSIDAPEGFTDNPGRDDEGHIVQTLPAWRSTPLDGVLQHEMRATLDRAIAKLPTDYRMVFLLRDVEERSAEETAKILKLSVPAVKSRLHRARAFLRNQLDGYMRS